VKKQQQQKKNSEIKTTMLWSLLCGKKMAALEAAIDSTTLVDPTSQELPHQAASSK